MNVTALRINPSQDNLQVDADLLRKFNVSGPRYTSYPTADRFVEAFDEAAYRSWLAKRNVGGVTRSLALYVHLPFCDTICYYCGCNKIVTKDHGRSAKYLKYLGREIRMQGAELGGRRRVTQMHWGGGTPTFLSEAELTELMQMVRDSFELDPHGEYAIEVDPRKVGEAKVALLAALGMNRISVGVQDFNPEVQRAVNRIQSLEETTAVIDAARKHGFKSVNMDLIYGLPKQTLAGFRETLAQVIACSPDRIALYNYAHLPAVFKPQRRILDADMPQPEVKLQLMINAIETLLAAGYVYIGMDHFSKPDDDLAVAQRQGRLYRNFQGYSTYGDCDLIGLGVSAIGKIGPTYSQNVRTLEEYYDRLDSGLLPVMRGIEVTADDLVRRAVIQALSCHFELSMEAIGIAHLIGLGVSAIGKIGPTYSQNVRTLEEYYDRLDSGLLPVMRGIEVTADDLVRRAVIQALSCHFELSMEAIGIAHLIDFRSYFATELEELRAYAQDGLVEIDGDWIVVTPRGRLLVRILCMVFDKYLRQASRRASYSKVI